MRFDTRLRSWLRPDSRRTRTQHEMDNEARCHIPRKTKDLIPVSMSPEQAGGRAVAEFEPRKDECREALGLRLLHDFRSDLRFGVRLLWRSPVFATVAILSLALGIGANTALFCLFDELVLRSLPVPNPHELGLLTVTTSKRAQGVAGDMSLEEVWGREPRFPYPLYRALRDSNQVFSGLLAAIGPRRVQMSTGGPDKSGSSQDVQADLVSGNYFSVLGVHSIFGRVLTADDESVPGSGGVQGPVAVLSYRFWKRHFFMDPAVLGSSIMLNGAAFTVVGVARPGFDGESVGSPADVWVPVSFLTSLSREERLQSGQPLLTLMGRLKPVITRSQAQEAMQALFQHIPANASYGVKFSQFRILVKDGNRGLSSLRNRLGTVLSILMGAVGLVLLISCANLATLLLARAAARRKEVAVRLSVGAGRARLLRQLLTESLLLAVIGGIVGVFLAQRGAALLTILMSDHAPDILAGVDGDIRVLGFTAAITLLACLIFGLAPALQTARADVNSALNFGSSSLVAGMRPSKTIGRLVIAVQVALSVVLLMGALLFVRTLRNLENLDIGFDREHTLLISFDLGDVVYRSDKLSRLADDFERRIRALPRVVSTSVATSTPFAGSLDGSPIQVPGYVPHPDDPFFTRWNLVGPEFFRTSGIPLRWGREFGRQDADPSSVRPERVAGPPVSAVVNESFVTKFFSGQNPVGKRFTMRHNTTVEIVGVAKDAKYDNLREQNYPMIYLSAAQDLSHFRSLSLVVRFVGTSREAAGLISLMRSELKLVSTGVRISTIQTLQNLVDRSLLEERMAADLSSIAGMLAVLLVSIGLYGVVAYTAARRTQELAIRIALGARQMDIFRVVLQEVFWAVLAGLALGVPLALGGERMISSKLFGISATDPLTICMATLLMTLVAAMSGFVPAYRASRVDPMVALRYD